MADRQTDERGMVAAAAVYMCCVMLWVDGWMDAPACLPACSLSLCLSVQPFADNQQGSTTGGYPITVVGLPHPYTPHPPHAPPPVPANAIRDGDARVADVAGWHVVFGTSDGTEWPESYVRCSAPDASLEIACGADNGDGKAATRTAESGADATRKAIRLHEAPTMMGGAPMETAAVSSGGMEIVPSPGPFEFQLFQRPWGTRVCLPNISAAALVQQGAGDARLKDVKMTLMVRHFPMRALALHHLRLCVAEGHWDGVTHIAK